MAASCTLQPQQRRYSKDNPHSGGGSCDICSVCNSTIIQHTVWQLGFECVASPVIFRCYRTRRIIVGPQLASFVRLCIGVLGVSAPKLGAAQVMLGGFIEAWLIPPRGLWASPTLQTAASCAFPFGPCLYASRPGSGDFCMLGSGARLVTCGNLNYNLSRCASTCSATNEVCQYYPSALCGSNFLVCCVLLWPRMPQLLPITVFGLQCWF